MLLTFVNGRSVASVPQIDYEKLIEVPYGEDEEYHLPTSPIVILYDNDVHGAFEGYAKMAATRANEYAMTPFVSVVSMGDYAQGGPLANYSHGLYSAEMINALGYDVVTLGNHEFDWGVEHCRLITDQIHADKVLCNFYNVQADTLVYAPYVIRSYGSRRIAFIGALTPTTQRSNSPQCYLDSLGNQLYSFCEKDFYEVVQKHVDAARSEGVDYVILLSHVGDVPTDRYNTQTLVASTKGIDVVLDGHSHSTVAERWLTNAAGDSVLVTSTGTKFQNIGRLEISGEGTIHSSLIPTRTLQEVDEGVEEIYQALQSTFGHAKSFGHTAFRLVGFDPKDNVDRNFQTNLGDFCTDALREMTGADIGWLNAGGMRTDIPAGDVSIKELISVFPFENKICVAEIPGRRILDALEYVLSYYPEDTGGFPQVSGLTYHLNPDVPSPVITDEQTYLVGTKQGEPCRAFDVRVHDEPIDPDRIYTVASIDYILKFNGCGGIFTGYPLCQDAGIVDIQLIEDYIVHLGREIPERYRERQQRMIVH